MRTTEYKDRIIARTRQLREDLFPELSPEISCLYTTYCLLLVLDDVNVNACVQERSTQWPRLTPEQDDGLPTTHTHFSFMWEPDSPTSMLAVAQHRLPEMHVWVGIPETQEVVDPNTHTIPDLCQQLAMLDWPGKQPPDYLWVSTDDNEDLPEDVVYDPNGEATFTAMSHMLRMISQYDLTRAPKCFPQSVIPHN